MNIHARPFYRPELDVLRLFAFLAVFVHHFVPNNRAMAPEFFAAYPALAQVVAGVASAGALGLPLFFMLSAFLITEILMSERAVTGEIHVRAFMMRRVLRIWPLYFFALGIAALLAMHHPRREEVVFLTACALFVGNWSYLIQPIPWANPFGPLWSISIEEQFYVLFPGLMKILRGRSPALLGIGTIGISLVFLAYSGRNAWLYENAWFNTLAQAMFFGTGILLAAALHGRHPVISNTLRIELIVLASVIAYITATEIDLPFAQLLLPWFALCLKYCCAAIACAAFFVAVYRAEWSFPKWAIGLGKISYGMYVYHTFSMQVVTRGLKFTHINEVLLRGLSLGLTIMLAQISYRFIERPILRYKERFAYVQTGAQNWVEPLVPDQSVMEGIASMSKGQETFKKGDHVEWKSQGKTIEGEVVKKLDKPTDIKSHHVAASKDNPEYLVKSSKTDAEAAHKPGSLHKK